MAFTRSTDFLTLLRDTGNGVRFERMPGLDWYMAAMAASGMINMVTDPINAPTSNVTTTVWFKPSVPAYAAEGQVWLWSAGAAAYVRATPQLWAALFVAMGA